MDFLVLTMNTNATTTPTILVTFCLTMAFIHLRLPLLFSFGIHEGLPTIFEYFDFGGGVSCRRWVFSSFWLHLAIAHFSH